MKPEPLFEVWSPDGVAECLPGVGMAELYQKLWALCKDLPVKHTSDSFAECCLARVWRKLNASEQLTLNILAIKHDKDTDRRLQNARNT